MLSQSTLLTCTLLGEALELGFEFGGLSVFEFPPNICRCVQTRVLACIDPKCCAAPRRSTSSSGTTVLRRARAPTSLQAPLRCFLCVQREQCPLMGLNPIDRWCSNFFRTSPTFIHLPLNFIACMNLLRFFDFYSTLYRSQ